jgi:hypothetical protein
MKHIDGCRKLGYIEHAPFAQHMDANLPDTCAHLFHGLPVGRLHASLNETQLETSYTPSFRRERFEVVKAGADELQRFHARDYMRFAMGISINLDKAQFLMLLPGESNPEEFGSDKSL